MNALKKGTTPLVDDAFFRELRKNEYSVLDDQNQTYLDYTGGNLYARSQILNHQKMLLETVFGNPHSTNPTSQMSGNLIDATRKKILEFFNAYDYTCVFTQNASAALKIVGESYPFNETSTFLILSDDHNSVNGIREYCNNKKGITQYVPVNYEDLQINDEFLLAQFEKFPKGNNNLFAYPAQSNVSGVKHDLKWIEYAQKKGFDVLLDAAAYVPSSKLDLSNIKPDFVALSFYKMFGYPTGVGALLIKNSSFFKLKKPWFAGGTVTAVSVVSQDKFLANGHERFEDGTLNYTNIPAVKIGIEYIESIGIDRITKRVRSLIQYLLGELGMLCHDNGKQITKIFGTKDLEHRGGNVIMNFFDVNGKAYPFEIIEDMAGKQLISIRSGCFCNPGIDEINNCLTSEEISKFFISRDKGDYRDMINFLGKMRGAIRVSVGIATVKHDLDKFIRLIATLKNKEYI